MQTTSDARKRSLQSGRTELDRIMRRTNELDTLLQKLYEDYALGRLPEKRHAKLSAQYEAEQAQLEQRSAELMEQMNAEQEESVNVDRFMELVDRYTDFTELTTPMLNEFIDKVIVYERRKINRYQYDQQIEIYFNFIGKVTLPEEETEAAPEAPKTLHVASNSSFAPIGDYLSAQSSRSDCAAVLQGGGTDRQAALQVGVQVRFLLVSGAGQTAFQYHLQRRIRR